MYGLPTAASLTDELTRLLSDIPAKANELPKELSGLMVFGRHGDRVMEFCDLLARAGSYSIDTFLEQQGERLRGIGKELIVALLCRKLLELEKSLTWGEFFLQNMREKRYRWDDDWLRETFDKMRRRSLSPDDFMSGNQVNFITFNFDRMIELRLANAAAALWSAQLKTDGQTALRTWAAERVLHVHGTLVPPATEAELTTEWIRQNASTIHIARDEVSDDTKARARKLLEEAERLCFLGFSFDEDNLAKLSIPAVLGKGKLSCIVGTAYQMPANESRLSAMRCGNAVTLYNEKCLDLLQNRNVFVE
jgi:hypothetical protein